jgi:hypothetical protein
LFRLGRRQELPGAGDFTYGPGLAEELRLRTLKWFASLVVVSRHLAD